MQQRSKPWRQALGTIGYSGHTLTWIEHALHESFHFPLASRAASALRVQHSSSQGLNVPTTAWAQLESPCLEIS
ncbi:hypothetical protein WJX84_001628 [Apatococcus fuscideae]|uniref:Uncharacterized protein n=1 Tax=Apatococcus fuscideae TaxID=2026836 RepID=A0AAW1SXS8_9CHLO